MNYKEIGWEKTYLYQCNSIHTLYYLSIKCPVLLYSIMTCRVP